MDSKKVFLLNKALDFIRTSNFDVGESYLMELLKFDRNNFHALRLLGVISAQKKQYSKALEYFAKCIKRHPQDPVILSNLGNVYFEMGQFEKAIKYHDNAINNNINYEEAWSNKGNTLLALKRYEEALQHYDRAIALKFDAEWLLGNYIHTKMQICSWNNLNDAVNECINSNQSILHPFAALSICSDQRQLKNKSSNYFKSKFLNTLVDKYKPLFKNEKLKIGYFSSDLYEHATAFLMAELFELHSKERFEIYAFSFSPIKEDKITQRLKVAFTKFIDVTEMSDIDIVKLSRQMNIDISVDLKGLTQNARTGIFALKPAPIQVNYLGFPGTIGSECIDYIIADSITIPVDSREHYFEKVVYLPNCYQVNDRKRIISDRKFTKQELNLPEHSFIFCCFNNNYKITPQVFDSWMRILNKVNESVLWLLQDNIWAAENLKKEARSRGIDPNRIIFAERMALPDHLARHKLADLFLDTLPYNAHTTASDALWAGLPVLTQKGSTFPGRVAASLLTAIGLPELITNSQEEYEALAINLAQNQDKLNEIRERLSNNRLKTPLFDTELFVKNIEKAYTMMHERYKAGLAPDHLVI